MGFWRNPFGRENRNNYFDRQREKTCVSNSTGDKSPSLIIDWIRAKARFELSMLLVRTKTAGQKGAFAHDDYRM